MPVAYSINTLIFINQRVIYIHRIVHKLQRSISVGERLMLETSKERVKLLKAGIDIKTIEKLYIIYNNFKLVRSQLPKENLW